MNDLKKHMIARFFLVLLATSAIWLAGCFDEYPCTEIGCEGDLICNAQTGRCEDFVSSCVETDDCAEGLTCDISSGECRAPGARCVDDSCPTHQVCNAQTGYCEARSNCELDPCTGAAEQCDPVSGRCVALDCDDENLCPTAFYCSSGGVCRAGCRIDDENGCVAGEFCRGGAEEAIGQCRKECHGDHECPLGQLCRDAAGGGASCERESRCDSDADCRDEGVCMEHICRAPPCLSDMDCDDNEACDRPSGECIGGDCEEDVHAPNQSVEQAVELRPGSYSQLQICPLRSDWFSLKLRSSDFLRVRMEHGDDVDLDLFVYDVSGRLLGANQQTGPVTQLEMRATQTQTVNLQVRGTRTEAAPYSLRIQRNPDQTFCRDDAYEENDRPADATVLPTGPNITVERPLQLCGPDLDWFVLPSLNASQGLEIGQSAAGSEVLIDLFTPDGEHFALRGKDSSGSGLFYMARLGSAGDYYIRASSVFSNSMPYTLRTRVRPPMECEEAGEHALSGDAEYLAPNVVSRRAFCPLEEGWEVDWIALSKPAEAGELSARVVVVGDLPPLDIALFREKNDDLELMRNARFDGERYNLRLPVDAEDTYLIRISTDAPLGRILEGVDYQVFYRFESAE